MDYKISSSDMQKLITAKLSHVFGIEPSEGTNLHYYSALSLVIKDILSQKKNTFEKNSYKHQLKRTYYLCMEFLIGRSLKNNLYNLGLEDSAKKALASLGIKLEDIYEEEPDAGLGNGGLGRLAACFLDSLSTQGYPAMGYSLRYEYGMFSQKLVDGWQTELPEFWMERGNVWLQPRPEKAVEVRFNGHIEESWDGNYHQVRHVDATKVIAIPFDMMISGKDSKCVSRLRLWSAESQSFDMNLFNSGNYEKAMQPDSMAEVITKVLYPEDNHAEGKTLRLSQQYLLVAATIKDIVNRHLRHNETLDNLPDLVAIHLNDTHPVLAIAELMRLMLDTCGYPWETAWDIITRTFAYTNHTVMSEALECWRQDTFKILLPRIYQIIEEINRRFCAKMHELGVDGYQVGRMAILNDGLVKMANLAVATCYSVNGVSKLHSEILKNTVFHDFYTVMPYKFKNVTNGIAYRRWLDQSNPRLAGLIKELISDKYVHDASDLINLLKYKDDPSVLERLSEIKLENKKLMAKYIKAHNNIVVDPESIFDVQAKRLHEYKRQHLNALHILSTYQWLRDNPNADFVPKTYIFGAKAAAGYYFAKEIIRFIVNLGNTINNDPKIKDKLKVVFLEDYRVTLAEKLMPAAEISEQISLAGTEASGTGNMKFMINGAITLGTLDGANVEIEEAVGRDNIIIFGMTASEVQELKKSGYNPTTHYNNNQIIKKAIDEMSIGFGKVSFQDIKDSLLKQDKYMVLADFADYASAQKNASELYKDKMYFNKMSLINIANSGRFSADRAINEYAKNIWNTKPIK